MSETKYYEETATASLSAPEIAICLEQIDRMNPKSTYKFRIPALTPDMNNTEKATDKKIVQKMMLLLMKQIILKLIMLI